MAKYVTYSNIRKTLKIEVTKAEQFGLAYLTHYLQNNQNGTGHYFRLGAVNYSQDIFPSVLEEPYFQGFLPIKI